MHRDVTIAWFCGRSKLEKAYHTTTGLDREPTINVPLGRWAIELTADVSG